MNGFGMYPTALQGADPLTTGAPGYGMMPGAGSIGLPPSTYSGGPASPTAAGAPPMAATLMGLFGGAVGPQAARAAQLPMAQQAALYGGAQTPAFGGGGLAPGDALAALIAGTNF
jgi:hypothetical protein